MQTKLQSFFEENFSRYLEIYENMVSTNSYTDNPAGVNAHAKFTADQFVEMGFEAEYVQSSNPDFGKHLVLTRKGRSDQRIGLISHLDTVFSVEEEQKNEFFWRIEADRVYGPGTNDIKGGTVMILMVIDAIKKFAPSLFDEITWVILSNAAEERWSNDFGELCRERIGPNGIAALVFEAGYHDGEVFSLVAARKGMAVYDIKVEGRSAHAGNGHQTGASAIVQMAHLIQEIANLTDYNKDLTFNVGVLEGGTVPNRIPHLAAARGEMRTFSNDAFQEGVENLLALNQLEPLKSNDGDFSCKIAIQVILENSPWPRNPATDRLFDHWQTIAETMGMHIVREERGGLSDGNQLWDFVPTIDGLGPSGGNAHCSERSDDGSKDQEFATLSSFIPKAILNTLAIIQLAE